MKWFKEFFPDAKTVPKIVFDDGLETHPIGGYEDLVEWLKLFTEK